MHIRTVILGGALVAAGVAVSGGVPAASAAPQSVDCPRVDADLTVPAGPSVEVGLCGRRAPATTARGGLGHTPLGGDPWRRWWLRSAVGVGARWYNGGGDGGPSAGVAVAMTDVRRGSALSVAPCGRWRRRDESCILPSPNSRRWWPNRPDGAIVPNAGLGHQQRGGAVARLAREAQGRSASVVTATTPAAAVAAATTAVAAAPANRSRPTGPVARVPPSPSSTVAAVAVVPASPGATTWCRPASAAATGRPC